MRQAAAKPFKKEMFAHSRFSKINLAVFAVIFAGIGTYLLFKSFAATGPAAMPLISQGKPAFTSSGTAADGNDGDYSTYWQPSSSSAWLAYDLSSVPASQRGNVVVAWYNDPVTSPYEYTVIADTPYSIPKNYTIDVNAASGGGSAPTSGWVSLATVTNNTYHSRQHLINMAGYNWVRINITASLGGSPSFNMDIHNASAGVADDWMFYGDSITQDGMPHQPVDFSTGSNYSQLIHSANSAYYPAFEDGGIGGLASADLAAHINTWLPLFPGHYVAMSYGTNDANGCMSPTAFYSNMASAVNTVLAAGKVPIIPTIPASKTAAVQSCGPGINAQIQNLYNNFPQIIHGPDLWSFFAANPSLISSDNLHPTMAGYVQMRQQWANAMIANVYNVAPSAPSNAALPTITGSTNVGSVLNASTGTWNNGPTSYAYQWLRCDSSGNNCSTIAGVTTNSYTLQSADANTTIEVTVTATNSGGSASATSAATALIRASAAPVAGDCNGDSHVTVIDLSTLLSHYNSIYASCDFNSDGTVNIFDLSILLSHYGT